MLRDRYDPQDLFTQIPKLCLHFEPVLSHLDRLLEDDELVTRVKADLAKRHPKTLTRGRPSTPVEAILRLLVVKRLYGWSYEETEHFVADSLILRQFCRLYFEAVPDDTTLMRWANQIGPATLEQLNERVVALAKAAKVTRGRKLRVDGTAVETNIHHPTDGSLIADGVRVLSRLLRRAKGLVADPGELRQEAFRDRRRSVRSLVRTIHRLARRQRAATQQVGRKAAQKASETAQKAVATAQNAAEGAKEAMKQAYQRLIKIGCQSKKQAQQLCGVLRAQSGQAALRWVKECAAFVLRLEQVLRQASRRVLEGEAVPANEKLVSLFEPHTRILNRGKPGREVEFGRKLWLEEVEGGIVSGYALLEEGAEEEAQVAGSLGRHQQRFGKAPELLVGDRGVSSPRNEALAKEAGVKRVVLPYAGKAKPERVKYERQGWFRRGYRFRAGIEGRISVLQRRFGLKRCLYQGEEGMGRWVGWAIVTSNLLQIARAQAAVQGR
jgi:transposase, IS5 family